MTTDPVDDYTFWYVNEYYAYDNSYNWKTALGGFYYTPDSGMCTMVNPDTLFFSTPQQTFQGIKLNIINPNPLNAAVLYNDPSGTFSGIDVNWYVNNPDPSPYFINSNDTLTLEVKINYSDNYFSGDYYYDTLLLVSSLDTHNIIIAFADSLLTSLEENDHSAIHDLKIQPNPSRGFFRMSFELIHADKIEIELMDLRGNSLDKLLEQNLDSGDHELIFQVGNLNLSQGVYLLILKTPSLVETRKLIIMK